jgi:Uma2 family endonuclease
MAALPDLITVEQFRRLPKGGEFAYELHHGEVVAVTRPRSGHVELQFHLREILGPRFSGFGVARTEYPYRPVAEFDLRAADVAVISRARWGALDSKDNLRGAPELVIEIKSPSNTRKQFRDLAALCLANGAIEFWIVDADKKSVSVVRREGAATVYGPGTKIPLSSFVEGELAVDEIFV